jgi:hypothetical protein
LEKWGYQQEDEMFSVLFKRDRDDTDFAQQPQRKASEIHYTLEWSYFLNILCFF